MKLLRLLVFQIHDIKVDSVKKILFTNLVDGPYLGKQPTFKERGVYLNKDLKVIQIINKN